jgi:demethylmenaquinone methyltransferase / 2-methoxy-6-polyprenyl-1,4-benzoquinol methylase
VTAPPAPTDPVLPAPEDKQAAVESMFDRVATDYERVNRVISLGLDRRWRRKTADRLGLEPGALVFDLACGTGDFGRILCTLGMRSVGVDLSANMLTEAAARDARDGRPLRLIRGDACRLPFADVSADGITCGFALRNFVDLRAFFGECARVLRKGGRVAMVDAATPHAALARSGHRLWFGRMVPWLGRRMSDPDAYRYLAASTVYLPDAPTLRSLVEGAGFDDVYVSQMTLGAVAMVTATRR